MLAGLMALPAGAQVGVGTIGGRITDENGPIEGVTVVAIQQATNVQYYATTDRHGWYQLLDVMPGGPYTVRIHYFEYKPLTVRGLYVYAGQNAVVDADLEAGVARVRSDEAATSLRLGPDLAGGAVPVSPLGFDLVSQRIYSPVVFDVRDESPLVGASQQWTVPTGSNRFRASAYGFYGVTVLPESASSYAPPEGMPDVVRQQGIGGLTLSMPLGSEDYLLFGGAQYDACGLSAAGRFDARINESNRVAFSGGRLAGGDIANGPVAQAADGSAWGEGDWFLSLAGGAASNRLRALWSDDASMRQLAFGEDFTLAAGRQRLLAGVQVAHQQFRAADSTATRFDLYLQDVVRLGQRFTVQAGVRFTFPFAVSPRLSFHYDVLGNGGLVLRAGTAVYGRHGEGTVWKNLAAIDTRLPLDFKLTFEGIFGQSWRKAFYISTRNIPDSHYALTARLERPFADRAWAVASYTHTDGTINDQILAGFSYKVVYLSRLATTLAVLYNGCSVIDDLSPASFSWEQSLEARLSQDLVFTAAGRDHTLQLTAYLRTATQSSPSQFLLGLRYLL